MGLLQRLFGKKDTTTVQAQQSKGAYFLDADSAKTFGNIDYMRQAKTVERTFPKVEGMNEGGRRKIKQFSAMEAQTVYDGDGKPNAPTPSSSSSSSISSTSSPLKPFSQQAKSSNDMNTFRDMARNIRR